MSKETHKYVQKEPQKPRQVGSGVDGRVSSSNMSKETYKFVKRDPQKDQ